MTAGHEPDPYGGGDDPVLREALDLIDAGDAVGLAGLLGRHPGLADRRFPLDREAYFRDPSLLEFLAENPVRCGRLPPNIADLAQLILAAESPGSTRSRDATLALVASGRVPRECGVQTALILLLCHAGADPASVLPAALIHGEFAAADTLLDSGAPLDLPAAAALGRTEDARALLPAADAGARHQALALSARFGHTPILALLLESGEDPNRLNPAGHHAHSTPLHQAALAGHRPAVTLLLQHGARTDIPDTLFGGTALDWAGHGGARDVAALLRGGGPDPA